MDNFVIKYSCVMTDTFYTWLLPHSQSLPRYAMEHIYVRASRCQHAMLFTCINL